MDDATPPDLDQLDSEALKSLILAQREQLASRDVEIEHLKLLIAKLRGLQFGRSSEKLNRQIEQLELQLEEFKQSRQKTLRFQWLPKKRLPRRRRKHRSSATLT